MARKPDKIELAVTPSTDSRQAAADAILEYWDETHNLSEIAEKSGFSASHVAKVYRLYFASPDGQKQAEAKTESGGSLAGRGVSASEMVSVLRDRQEGGDASDYESGYKDGFWDGFLGALEIFADLEN